MKQKSLQCYLLHNAHFIKPKSSAFINWISVRFYEENELSKDSLLQNETFKYFMHEKYLRFFSYIYYKSAKTYEIEKKFSYGLLDFCRFLCCVAATVFVGKIDVSG